MPFLSLNKHSLVTVTIQDDELRLLQLIKRNNLYIIEAMAVQALSSLESEIIIEALQSLTAITKTQGHIAAFALPAQNIIQKTLKLSKEFNQAELFVEFKENISNYITGAEHDFYFDFAIIDENELEQVVLLTACQKKLIGNYRQMFQQAKLKLKIIDIDYYALVRAASFPSVKPAAVFGVLEIKQDNLHFLLIRQHYIYFRQICPISLESLQQIQKTVSPLAYEIQYIVLVGEAANQAVIDEWLQQLFKVPLLYSNPFQTIHIPDSLKIPNFENKMLVNLGLALRSGSC